MSFTFHHNDLSELKKLADLCFICPLAERRQNVVFGEGNDRSPLMLIGEGPGEQEDSTGRPFVGRAGQLLTRGLEDAGLSRNEVFITNTVKCRAADWSTGKPQNRAPTFEEALACRDWLVKQITIIKPRIILCIGAPSAKNLIRNDLKITRERGRLFQSDLACGILATLHPSYILRQANISGDGGYHLFVEDIKKAWDLSQRLVSAGKRSPLDLNKESDF